MVCCEVPDDVCQPQQQRPAAVIERMMHRLQQQLEQQWHRQLAPGAAAAAAAAPGEAIWLVSCLPGCSAEDCRRCCCTAGWGLRQCCHLYESPYRWQVFPRLGAECLPWWLIPTDCPLLSRGASAAAAAAAAAAAG